MFMQHRVVRKGLGPNTMTGAIENVFRDAGVHLVGAGDGWRLGSSGSALVLVQVMGIDNAQCFVMTVASSPDQNPAAIADAVNGKLRGVATL